MILEMFCFVKVLLAQPETANFITVTGSMLLKNMATLNGKVSLSGRM